MNRTSIFSSGSASIHQEPVTEQSVLSMRGGGRFGVEKARCGLRSPLLSVSLSSFHEEEDTRSGKVPWQLLGVRGRSLPDLKSVVLTAAPQLSQLAFPSSRNTDLQTLHGVMDVSLRHDGKANAQGRPEENAGPPSLPGLPWLSRALIPVAEQRSGRALVSSPLSRTFPEP